MITALVMLQLEPTRTLENSTARRMLEPTTTQPPEIRTLAGHAVVAAVVGHELRGQQLAPG